MFGNRARCGDRTSEPLVADESKRSNEADPRRLNASFVGDAFHLKAHEIVGEEDAPQLLVYGGIAAARERLPAC